MKLSAKLILLIAALALVFILVQAARTEDQRQRE